MIRWVLNVIVLLLLLRPDPAGRESAIAVRVGAETRYYCSVTCRDKDAAAGFAQPRMGRAAHG